MLILQEKVLELLRFELKRRTTFFSFYLVSQVQESKHSSQPSDFTHSTSFDACTILQIIISSKMFIGEYSMLLVSFHLQRHMGNFLIQVYGPCVLLVVLSWVSFWLNREATADRVSLGKLIKSVI